MSERPRGGGPGRGPQGMMPGEKAKNFKETMRTLATHTKPYKGKIILVFAFAIISTIFSISAPIILGTATDVIFQGVKGEGIDFDRLFEIVLILVILYLISFIFSYLQGFIMAGVSQKISYNLRKRMSEKIEKMPLKYFDTKTHGEILSRVTNDIDTVNTTLNQSLTQMVTSITTIIGVVAMMIYINLMLTLVALIIIPLSFILIKLVIGKSQKYFKDHQRYLGELNGHIEEMYTGHVIVKAFCKEEDSIEKFKKINNQLSEASWKSQFLSGLMMPLMGLVGNIAYVFVCVLGGYLAVKGSVTIGNIQAFMQYVRTFQHPISQAANIANVLQSTAAAAERVFEFLSEEEESFEVYINQEIDFREVKGHVEFSEISFGYNEEEILIKNFNFEVQPGQKIAIVGPTGAGKTTIVKLLMRFYELNEGKILIDGIDISKIHRYDLHKMLGMVLQDTWLFNGSIMENIRYGRTESTDEDVKKAAKAAHIHHFVNTLPNGYETIINEEASNISQGQKQLLTIARAILSNAPILILDEATSSVDTRTEIQIQEAMNNLMCGRTSFIIAHRLSTIRDADVIMVMDKGNIVEIGPHDELLKNRGFYWNLYSSQFDE